jgi:hypothetical protein
MKETTEHVRGAIKSDRPQPLVQLRPEAPRTKLFVLKNADGNEYRSEQE